MKIPQWFKDRVALIPWRQVYLYFKLTSPDGAWRPIRLAYMAFVTWLVLSFSWWWVLAYFVDATFKPDPRSFPGAKKRTGERTK